MNMIDHADNPREEYHFESSMEFCSPEVVLSVEKKIRSSMSLTPEDSAQLKAIVELELMRYDFAHGQYDATCRKQMIQAVRNKLIKDFSREPFEDGPVDKAFYKALNREYGYV